MPMLVSSSAAVAEASVGTIEMVGRSCRLKAYRKLSTIPRFQLSGDFIAYASPDSTYAVTRRLLSAATESILIGIYDFSSDYMKDILLQAMTRGVKVSLMLDIDNRREQDLFEELERFGCKAVPAPSCASKTTAHYFASSHEKVIVIDGEWCLVQSGNYSNNSIPFNEVDGGDPDNFVKGNRDMGVAVKSKPLAEFFTKVLKSDMKLELDATTGPEALRRTRRPAPPDLVELVPELLPARLFPSKGFNPAGKVDVTPVLSPDNYMDFVPEKLRAAKASIFIENQYIRSQQPQIKILLAAIAEAISNRPSLDVRIILGKLFNADDVAKEKANIANIQATYGLKLGVNIRYIDTTRFVHCHNKVILVDGESVLISSQNWSDSAVSKNREAGLWIEYPQLAKYYEQIFESDWGTAQVKIPRVGRGSVLPEALARGRYVTVSAADYQDV